MMMKGQSGLMYIVVFLIALSGILYGYDIGVISGALIFIRNAISMSDVQISAIVGAVMIGNILGTVLAGPLADRYGRRAMIIFSSVFFILGVCCIVLAQSFGALLLARVLLGAGGGIVAVSVPVYVAELAPEKKRGQFVCIFQLFFTLGILLAYVVDVFFAASGNWRAMFAVLLIPALALALGVTLLPESPRWLIAKGYMVRAQRVLMSILPPKKVKNTFSDIQQGLNDDMSHWTDLLSPKLMLPLVIAVGIAVLNQLTGINSFLQYAPVILTEVGVRSNTVMMGAVSIALMNCIGTVLAMLLIDRAGRRFLLILGIAGLLGAEILLSVIHLFPIFSSHAAAYTLIGLAGYILFYALGPGVVVWLVFSELFPTRVRGKAMAVCLFFNSFTGAILASVFLDLMHTVGMAYTYGFCAVASLLYLVLVIFYLPETKAKSLEEVQAYFDRNVAIPSSDQSTSGAT